MNTRGRVRLRWLMVGAVGSVVALLPSTAFAQPTGTGAGTTAVGAHPAVSSPLFSARRVPALMQAHVADAQLQTRVNDIMKVAPSTSCIEISDHGRVILRVNGDEPLEPASTNKVLTATGLLARFSPDDKMATRVLATAAPQNGIVDGDVWLVGGGDAMLTTPGYAQSLTEYKQMVTDFAPLADKMKAAGVTRITGRVIGDDSRYDKERYVPSWPQRFQGQDTVGPLSALIVNDGVTGYTTDPDAASATRKAGDPPVLAAQTLVAYLRARGIEVTGEPTTGSAPTTAVEVARIETTMRDEITEMLSFSDNTTAELLNKELGLAVGGTGTTVEGTRATRTTLDQIGLPTAGLVMADASGLDDSNRLTCDLLVGALDHHGADSELARGLSIWGQRGTLRNRVRGTPLDGQIMAKTGTLTKPPVAALAGFEKTAAGSTLSFAFIQNGPKSDANLQDKLVQVLFDYPQAPDISALVPR